MCMFYDFFCPKCTIQKAASENLEIPRVKRWTFLVKRGAEGLREKWLERKGKKTHKGVDDLLSEVEKY